MGMELRQEPLIEQQRVMKQTINQIVLQEGNNKALEPALNGDFTEIEGDHSTPSCVIPTFYKDTDDDRERTISKMDPLKALKLKDWYQDKNTLCFVVGSPIDNHIMGLPPELRHKKTETNIPLMPIPVKNGKIYENYFWYEPYEGIVFDKELIRNNITSIKNDVEKILKEMVMDDIDLTVITKEIYEDYKGLCSLYLKINASNNEGIKNAVENLDKNFIILPNRKLGYSVLSAERIAKSNYMVNSSLSLYAAYADKKFNKYLSGLKRARIRS